MAFKRVLVCCLLMYACSAMFHKKQRVEAPEDRESPEKDFKADLEDLLLSTDISAQRSGAIWRKGARAGHKSFRANAKAASSGGKNANRNLLTTMMKQCKWPCKLYWAEVTVWSIKKQAEQLAWLPLLLPHEIVKGLSDKAFLETLLCKTGMSQDALSHLKAMEEQSGTPLIGLGLWGDGVPCNYDRSQSLEVWSLNLPGLAGLHQALRFPITVVNKRYVMTHKTHDDILKVVRWSLEQCLLGQMPAGRHDGKPWRPDDCKRRKLAGQPFPHAVLCEVRGDWAFYKQVFRFPQHNEIAGCCWRCCVTPSSFRNVSADAPWRSDRLSHWQLLRRMNDLGQTRSPLFGAPGVTSSIFMMDWLHTADKGVTADFLGSLFNLLLTKMPGDNREQRRTTFFLELQDWYKNNPVDSKLDNLTSGMIGKKNGPYSLKAKAAEARALVPFAVYASNRWLSEELPMEGTVQQAAYHLQACYSQLSRASFNHETLKQHSRKFCLLAVALEEASPDNSWRLRPKIHLFQEMNEMQDGCPSTCWTYRDEDFGGSMIQVGRRGGGSNNPTCAAKAALQRFMARNPFPRLL